MTAEDDLVRLAAAKAWLSPVDAEALLALAADMTDAEADHLWTVGARIADKLISRELRAVSGGRGDAEITEAHLQVAEAVVELGLSEAQERTLARLYGDAV
jgi:predicted component of type VI protein secretion system